MLYHKLAYKNVRASFHDYLLYFLTLALTARLERVTGRPVILRRRTEAGLLGGMWVEIEGHRMEDTLRGRLTDVERMWTKWS